MSSISKQRPSINWRKASCSSTEVRLVMLGRTGNGKSSTANSILGCKAFESKVGSCSVTQRCRRVCGDFRGRHITILDTPGLLNTQQTPQEVQRELRKSVALMYPGPHAFLLVFQIGRFTQEEKEAVQQIKQVLGPQALGFSVVVFTHGDCLDRGTSVRPCLIEGSEGLAELVDRCGGRYCIFNNQNSKSKEQVSELLDLVDSMLGANKGSCYTSKMLHEAEEEMAQKHREERRLLKEKEELIKRKQETSIREWYQSELEKIHQESKREMEELRKKMKRAALQEKLDRVTKAMTEREERMKRAMEEKIQQYREANEKIERERQFQHIKREQAIRQTEEMKREAMQKELDNLTQSLEEQSRARDELIRRESEENQGKGEREMKNQRDEKRQNEAPQRQLGLITMKLGEQKASEERLKRELEESLWKEKEICDVEMDKLKKQCDKKCSELCNEEHGVCSFIRPVSGYVQEMGLVVLNAALNAIGATCSLQ